MARLSSKARRRRSAGAWAAAQAVGGGLEAITRGGEPLTRNGEQIYRAVGA